MFLIVIFFPEMMPNIFFLISHDQLMLNIYFFLNIPMTDQINEDINELYNTFQR